MPGAVEPEHADLGAVEVGEVDVLENDLFLIPLGDADHRIDDLVGFRSCHGVGNDTAPAPGPPRLDWQRFAKRGLSFWSAIDGQKWLSVDRDRRHSERSEESGIDLRKAWPSGAT